MLRRKFFHFQVFQFPLIFYSHCLIIDKEDTEEVLYEKRHEKDALKKLEQILGVEISDSRKFVDKDHPFWTYDGHHGYF